MSTLAVNGATLAYENSGQGEPILFIHGIYCSRHQWNLQVNYFEKNYRVITCDLRGHGQSSATDEPYSVALFAEDIVALLDELGLEKVICCGHSFGGLVAQELAINHPERVKAVILAETLYGLCSTPWDLATSLTMNVWLPKILGIDNYVYMAANFFGMFTPGGATYIVQEGDRFLTDKANQENIMNASLLFDSRWRLHRINCPTLLLVGQYPHIPLVYLHNWEMYWRIKGAEFAVIPKAGHLLFWDNPSAFNEAIVKFLDKLPA